MTAQEIAIELRFFCLSIFLLYCLNKKNHETSHEQISLTHEYDYLGEFHLANEIKIINR